MVDDDRGADEVYKHWYLSLTQAPDLLVRNKVGGLRRRGRSLLLDDAVVALVRHLLDSGLVRLTETEVLNGPKWDHEHVPKKRKRR